MEEAEVDDYSGCVFTFGGLRLELHLWSKVLAMELIGVRTDYLKRESLGKNRKAAVSR